MLHAASAEVARSDRESADCRCPALYYANSGLRFSLVHMNRIHARGSSEQSPPQRVVFRPKIMNFFGGVVFYFNLRSTYRESEFSYFFLRFLHPNLGFVISIPVLHLNLGFFCFNSMFSTPTCFFSASTWEFSNVYLRFPRLMLRSSCISLEFLF